MGIWESKSHPKGRTQKSQIAGEMRKRDMNTRIRSGWAAALLAVETLEKTSCRRLSRDIGRCKNAIKDLLFILAKPRNNE